MSNDTMTNQCPRPKAQQPSYELLGCLVIALGIARHWTLIAGHSLVIGH